MTAEDRRNGLESDEDAEMVDLRTEVTDEELKMLESLTGQELTSMVLVTESLVYADEEYVETPEEERFYFDCDLYFADHQLLELYGASLYENVDSDPVTGMERIEDMLTELFEEGGTLTEVARDDEDGLVLVLSSSDDSLLVAVSGWYLDTWEELPDIEDED